MEWTQFIIMFLGMVGLFAWNRTEARADARHFDARLETARTETNALIEAIRQDVKEFHQEMKNFHGRLCEIEERNKK